MNDDDFDFDLDRLRDGWDAPPAPDSAARSAARAALLERAHEPAPARSERTRRLPKMGTRLIAVGALAAALAAAMTVVQTSDHGRSVVPGVPPGPSANAAATLDHIAQVTERRLFKPPRPNQWIYSHFQNVKVKQRWPEPGSETNQNGEPTEQIFEEQWERGDGKKSAILEGGKLHFFNDEPEPGGWPPEDYAGVARLPTDPDKLLALAYEQAPKRLPPRRLPKGCVNSLSEERTERAFTELGGLLWEPMLPPRVEAAVYRAMRKLPGMVLTKVTSPAGRPEIAIGQYQNGYALNQMLFDARTLRYTGQRSIFVKDPGEVMKKCHFLNSGEVLNMRVLEIGVVNKPGQRPKRP